MLVVHEIGDLLAVARSNVTRQVNSNEKDSITAEYALGGLSNKVFASRYVLLMPDKEQLIAQVEEVLEKRNESDSGSKAK